PPPPRPRLLRPVRLRRRLTLPQQQNNTTLSSPPFLYLLLQSFAIDQRERERRTPTTLKKTTPFLGFSLATTSSKPSIQLNKVSKICCQDKAALIPAGQQWMFDDLTGPGCWNKTWYPKASDHVNTDKPWYVVDATDKILGRLASTIAIHIRGKNLATYTPSDDMGAFVIVVNAEKVAVSGKKRTQKLYRRHSGRPRGMKVEIFDQLQKRIPERIIEHAVRGMLPKGRVSFLYYM
ncbi:50S ribosomal protein l13 chloroplastic, partial [Phtheirospermum japonicum]